MSTPREATMTTETHEATGTSPGRASTRSGAFLWGVALTLAAVLGVRFWSLGEPPARADMAVKAGSYSMITSRAANAEVLVVVDDRNEDLLVYDVLPGDRFELRARESLPALFARARGSVGPRP